MDAVAHVFNKGPFLENDGVCEVWSLPSLLGVNAGEGQVLPQHLQQVVEVQLHTATTGKAVSGRQGLVLKGQVSIVREY